MKNSFWTKEKGLHYTNTNMVDICCHWNRTDYLKVNDETSLDLVLPLTYNFPSLILGEKKPSEAMDKLTKINTFPPIILLFHFRLRFQCTVENAYIEPDPRIKT